MPPKYQVTKLANGARIATAEMPHMESVSLGIWAEVGSRDESARLNGIAHFAEHMLFKGTARRTARKISLDIEGVGGSINAFTSEDHTCYYAKATADRLPRLADVLMDMYAASAFPAKEVRREREVIVEEIAMYRENPGQHVEDLLSQRCIESRASTARSLAPNSRSLPSPATISAPSPPEPTAEEYCRRSTAWHHACV
ncbi:MAG: pitrilysin family protein [Verrucomicrobiales bacterium]